MDLGGYRKLEETEESMRFTALNGKIDIEKDIQVILKMLQEEGPKSPNEIKTRMGLTHTSWNLRRQYLIGRGLIAPETCIKVTQTGRYKVTLNDDASCMNSVRI
jgi:hypothetical protein